MARRNASRRASAKTSPTRSKLLKSRPPLVWMFQPTTFELVTGDRLREWEKMMAEYVGLEDASPKSRLASGRGSATGTRSYSHSGPKDSANDDCDAD